MGSKRTVIQLRLPREKKRLCPRGVDKINNYKKTIVITAFKRPKALKALLESLCANELSTWNVLIRLEPSPQTDECISISEELLQGHDFKIHINTQVEGVRRNNYNAIESAFSDGAGMVLYLEEDLIVSPDTLSLCNWYLEAHTSDLLCLNLLTRITGSSSCFSNSGYPNELIKTKSFNSLGIALKKEQWTAHFKEIWLTRVESQLTHLGKKTDGWDFSIYSYLLSQPDLHVLQPLLARANHLGGEGTYCTEDYQTSSFSYVEVCDEKVEAYRVISIHNLTGADRAFFIMMDEMNDCLKSLKNLELQRRKILEMNITRRCIESMKEKIDDLKSSERVCLAISKMRSFISTNR